MGILQGNRLLDYMYNGLYKRNCDGLVNLYADGELLRFTGFTESNRTQRFAEESVALEAGRYISSRIATLARHLNKPFDNVYVYMDGKRVDNKIKRTYDMDLDTGLLRDIFKQHCESLGYIVVQLEEGESELHMYLDRDRKADLNVFLTKDTDMISILYGHDAEYSDKNEMFVNDKTIIAYRDDMTTRVRLRADERPFDEISAVHDLNDEYNDVSNTLRIRDSCVWAKCENNGKPLRMIGFDASAERLGYSKLVFSVFCSMLGTDFTNAIIAPSMIRGFFTCINDEELKRVNDYTLSNVVFTDDATTTTTTTVESEIVDQIFEIVVLILLAGFRDNGCFKRVKAYCGEKYRRTETIGGDSSSAALNASFSSSPPPPPPPSSSSSSSTTLQSSPQQLPLFDMDTGLMNLDFLQKELYTTINVYHTYVITGRMITDNIPRIKDPSTCVRTILQICMNGANARFDRPMIVSDVRTWARQISLVACLDNVKSYKQQLVLKQPKSSNNNHNVTSRRKLFEHLV